MHHTKCQKNKFTEVPFDNELEQTVKHLSKKDEDGIFANKN